MLKYLAIAFLCIVLPQLVLAQTELSVGLAWDPVWEYEDGTAADQEDLAHFNVYVCDGPIVAGGPGADDTRLEPATCVGTLKVIQATNETTDAMYAAPNSSGNLYFRVSAVSALGTESKLSAELTHPYNFQRLKAPMNLRVTVNN